MRRVLLSVNLLVLAVCVFALATQSKTAQYGSEDHLTSHYKATDGSDCKLKSKPVVPIVCQPIRVERPIFQTENFSADGPEVPAPPSVYMSATHGLRAPPAL